MASTAGKHNFSGLLYHIVFKGKNLKDTIDGIDTEITSVIDGKRSDPAYSKSPNRMKNLRERLDESISIIQRYVL